MLITLECRLWVHPSRTKLKVECLQPPWETIYSLLSECSPDSLAWLSAARASLLNLKLYFKNWSGEGFMQYFLPPWKVLDSRRKEYKHLLQAILTRFLVKSFVNLFLLSGVCFACTTSSLTFNEHSFSAHFHLPLARKTKLGILNTQKN